MNNDERDDGYSEEGEEEEDDDEDANQEFVYQQGDCDGDGENNGGQENDNGKMSIVVLGEYVCSPHHPFRELAAENIVECLKKAVLSVQAYSEQDDVVKVISYINRLSDDVEARVKITLLKSLPKIASFCSEYDSPLVSLKPLIVSYLLPIVLKAVSDESLTLGIWVQREGFKVLNYLISNNLVTMTDVEEKVCNIYDNLLQTCSCFNIISAGNFIARMPPVVGEELTEKLLVPRITQLCSNKLNSVREACVRFLVDLSCFTNIIITENIIVPHFIKLCQDEMSQVRRACAETIVMLACTCLMETRMTVLNQSFLDLLRDLDPTVTAVAFHHLGPFITTFAQPAITALASDPTGKLLLIYDTDFTFEFESRRILLFRFYEQEKDDDNYPPLENPCSNTTDNDGSNNNNNYAEADSTMMNDYDEHENEYQSENQQSSNNNEFKPLPEHNWNLEYNNSTTENEKNENENQTTKNLISNTSYFENQPDIIQSCVYKNTRIDFGDVKKQVTNNERQMEHGPIENTASFNELENSYNSFIFWRDPIPDIDEHDVNLISDNPKRKYKFQVNRKELHHMLHHFEYPSFFAVNEYNGVDFYPPNYYTNSSSTSGVDERYFSTPLKKGFPILPIQTIIPQLLLDAFVSMPETTNDEIRRQCAYVFPAVLLTLGAANWPHLSSTYLKLVNDSDWKLRKIIANSIHEIASIIGPELATKELVPIFNLLITNIEDVRVAALKHLAQFLKLLKPDGRISFLPELMNFTITDYAWNWRFRVDLVEQLSEILPYFSAADCWKYISAAAYTLLMDKVSSVRTSALQLMTNLIRVLSSDICLLRSTITELAEQFAHSTLWSRRQTFIFLCSSLLNFSALPDDMFARDVLPHLLDLSWDSIPNIRIAVARSLALDVITHPYFRDISSPHYEVLVQVLNRLSADKDRDVRYFASSCTETQQQISEFRVDEFYNNVT